jgi:predicted nucleic acid-binding protein
MIVVDANILAYFWLKSPYFEKVAELYETDPDWTAPDLCRSEFRNIAAAYLRKGLYTLEEVKWLVAQKESRMMGSYLEVDSMEVINLVSQSTCSSYDCEYVALAIKTMRPLITFDKKILQEFPNVANTVDQYISSLG